MSTVSAVKVVTAREAVQEPLPARVQEALGQLVGVAKEGLRTSIDLLQAGKALLIFPEGERTWNGRILTWASRRRRILRALRPDHAQLARRRDRVGRQRHHGAPGAR